jgi:hypothetical protein
LKKKDYVNTWINRGLSGNYRAAINLSSLSHHPQASRKTANNSKGPLKARKHERGKGFGRPSWNVGPHFLSPDGETQDARKEYKEKGKNRQPLHNI